jgi:internalin A
MQMSFNSNNNISSNHWDPTRDNSNLDDSNLNDNELGFRSRSIRVPSNIPPSISSNISPSSRKYDLCTDGSLSIFSSPLSPLNASRTPPVSSCKTEEQALEDLLAAWYQEKKSGTRAHENRIEAAKKIKECRQLKNDTLNLSGLQLTALPRGLAKFLPNVKTLILNNNKFESLESLSEWSHLDRLHMKYNQLKVLCLPDSWNCLTYINVSHNRLKLLFPSSTWSRLKTCDLSNNKLKNVSVLAACSELQSLDISDNRLMTLPSLDQWRQIKSLNAAHNNLKNVPPLTSVTQLEVLDVSDNEIESLPSLDSCFHLKSLDASSNVIKDIPSLSSCTRLTKLYLGENELKRLSSPILCTYLEELDLSSNRLIDIQLIQCNILKHLNLSDNKLEILPSLDECSDLESLNASMNILKNLPSLTSCIQLKELCLGDNKFKKLAFPIDCPCLTHLDLARSTLEEFELIQCTQLDFLDVSDNKLKTLPNLDACSKLKFLDISNNKLNNCILSPSLNTAITVIASNNKFSSIPEALKRLPRQATLNFIDNGLITPDTCTELRRENRQIREESNQTQGPVLLLDSSLQDLLDVWEEELKKTLPRLSFPDQEKILSMFTLDEQERLIKLLEGLRSCPDYENANTRNNILYHVYEMFHGAEENPDFLFKLKDILGQPPGCTDEARLTLSTIELHHHMIFKMDHQSLQQMVDFCVGMVRLAKIEETAIRILSEKGLGDTVEAALYCQLQLKEALKLPISIQEMGHPWMSGITPQELKQMQRDILNQTSS